ncbi:CLUMA_CG005467, isoform A [Clunio marinus]|uniref:CLUMA_CG005467, isoform A n=1 Tax=Clunio marinus TaxID=568069 RepID=A0A1J1HV11_9DIPT|nr:CLUMA_CG005467, isoform A [Clunio marinus]
MNNIKDRPGYHRSVCVEGLGSKPQVHIEDNLNNLFCFITLHHPMTAILDRRRFFPRSPSTSSNEMILKHENVFWHSKDYLFNA